jgi:MYXO-CTERM domain-containing protein
MTQAHKLNIASKTAIIAALMGGSSLSFAQDAAPTVADPAQTVPVEAPVAAPIVAPPPAVSTLPSANDVVNPVAAQEAEAEAAPKRQAVTPKVVTTQRVAAAVRATPTITAEPDMANEPSTAIAPPTVDAIEPAGTTIEDTASVAPISEPVPLDEGISTEDMTLVGGLAAALAAIGLGAAFASRRRRRIVADDRVAVVTATQEFAPPRPIKDDPVFQQFIPAATPAVAAQRPIQRAPIVTRPDVPVTDPLFSTPVMAPPITDPMFAPRSELQIPITDPLFAKHDRFVGRVPAASAVAREKEPVD